MPARLARAVAGERRARNAFGLDSILAGCRALRPPVGRCNPFGCSPVCPADETPGPACYCGRHGCIESWLSGPGLARDHAEVTGQTLTSHAIVRAATDGDAAAAATMARYEDRLARGLAMVINVLDPDVIVLGGGMSNVPGLAEAAQARLPRHVFSDTVLTRVVRHRHGDSSGVRGAAWLWPATP